MSRPYNIIVVDADMLAKDAILSVLHDNMSFDSVAIIATSNTDLYENGVGELNLIEKYGEERVSLINKSILDDKSIKDLKETGHLIQIFDPEIDTLKGSNFTPKTLKKKRKKSKKTHRRK